MTLNRFEFVSRTHTGLVRELNEDAFATAPERGLVIVADGMGGYHGGEIASRLAVDTIGRTLAGKTAGDQDLQSCLEDAAHAIEAANRAIWQATDEAPELRGMGTTALIGLFRPDELAFAWVGDSRLYRLRDGDLRQMNADHTLVQELVNQGLFRSIAEAKEAGVGDNVLTRALGANEPVLVDTGHAELAGGDLYLLCTDGLNHMIDDNAIQHALSDHAIDLESKADQLVQLACDAGGADNITLTLVRVNDR